MLTTRPPKPSFLCMFCLKTNDQIILKFDPGVYTKSCWALSFLAATSLESPLYIKIKLNFLIQKWFMLILVHSVKYISLRSTAFISNTFDMGNI